MVLQSELADEELEHFEDIVEDPDMQASKAADKPDTDGADDNDDDDDDHSEDGAASPAPSSDDEFSDKGDDDLLDFDGLTDLQESQRTSGQSASQSRVQNAKSSLPGGYDPRHREPIYWYFCLL